MERFLTSALGRLHRVLIRSGVGWPSSGDQAAASLPWPRRLAPPSCKPLSYPRMPGPQAVTRQYDPKLPTFPCLPRPWAVRNVEIATGKRRQNQKHRRQPAPESPGPRAVCPASQERASRFSLPETQRVPSTSCLILSASGLVGRPEAAACLPGRRTIAGRG